MNEQNTILYGDPDKDQVCINHFKGAASSKWLEKMRENTLHIIFNLSYDNKLFKLNTNPSNQRLITLAIDWMHQLTSHIFLAT